MAQGSRGRDRTPRPTAASLLPASPCCLPGGDRGSHGQGWHTAQVFLLDKRAFASTSLTQGTRGRFHLQQMAVLQTCLSRGRRGGWSQLGPVPVQFFSPAHCSLHTAPLFPFKSCLHQLFAWGDISGKCEEMAAEPKP